MSHSPSPNTIPTEGHSPRILEVRQGLLKANDELARELRDDFRRARASSWSTSSPGPGAGKTELLAGTWPMLRERGRRVAAVVGDLATDNDARRLAASGAPARQIITGTVCHLEAQMVRTALEGWDLAGLDYPVHRERRQPGLPRLVRPRRGPPRPPLPGHRRGGQAPQVPHPHQHRRRDADLQARPRRRRRIRPGAGPAGTSRRLARGPSCSRSRRGTARGSRSGLG